MNKHYVNSFSDASGLSIAEFWESIELPYIDGVTAQRITVERWTLNTDPIAKQVLDCSMGGNDIDAKTVREYLTELLVTLWEEAEGFSGKRPFGNSDWQTHVHAALVTAGLVEGSFDEDEYLESCDDAEADRLILLAIKSLS